MILTFPLDQIMGGMTWKRRRHVRLGVGDEPVCPFTIS